MTILEFLEARLAEDGATAQAAATISHGTAGPAPEFQLHWGAYESYDMEAGGLVIIAGTTPARVMAQVAAIRAVVALHSDTYGGYGESCAVCMHPEDELAAGAPFPCPTLCHVAAIWAYHPDYDLTFATGAPQNLP